MNDFQFVKRVIEVVSIEAGFERPKPGKIDSLLHNNREYYASKFRDDAILLARENTQLSLIQLGELFKRHHTSVLQSIRRALQRRDRNPPRKDKRSWTEWHNYLLEKVRACENSAPVA